MRVAVFIDGGYFRSFLRSIGEPRIDFLKLSEKVSRPDDRFRTYYYNCMPFMSPNPSPADRRLYSDMDRFINSLRNLPRFEVRLGRLRKYLNDRGQPTFEQKGVDVYLSVDMVRLAATNQIGRAILIGGDSDFVPAIKTAKENINVSLYYYRGTVHNELLQACDERFEMDNGFCSDILMNRESSPTRTSKRDSHSIT
ncbi:MAG: NYN domain-containing protein [Nitrososphaerota archaeon]|nr:NYN domain-containing protein [Nitrososphaerota archaeon]